MVSRLTVSLLSGICIALMNDASRLPTRPETLPLLAEQTLEALSAEPLASGVVLGGGVALKHYDDFRQTHAIVAWWSQDRDEAALEGLHKPLRSGAEAHGYTLATRRFGATDSFEFLQQARKQFSFQIALREITLDEPLESPWPPIQIETLRDNLASKMVALVMRGAPRDFLDIHKVVEDGLIDEPMCWELWRLKRPDRSISDAKGQVLAHLLRLEARRPLSGLPDPEERQSAERVRNWYKAVFLNNAGG